VREAGSWSTANASLQNVDPHNVQVLVRHDHAIVAIANPAEPPAYLLIRWLVRVDPATAAAYVKGDTLVVTAKHLASTGGTSAPTIAPQTSSIGESASVDQAPASPASDAKSKE